MGKLYQVGKHLVLDDTCLYMNLLLHNLTLGDRFSHFTPKKYHILSSMQFREKYHLL